MLFIDADIRVRQEDEDPVALIVDWLKEQKVDGRPIAIEGTSAHCSTRYEAAGSVRWYTLGA